MCNQQSSQNIIIYLRFVSNNVIRKFVIRNHFIFLLWIKGHVRLLPVHKKCTYLRDGCGSYVFNCLKQMMVDKCKFYHSHNILRCTCIKKTKMTKNKGEWSQNITSVFLSNLKTMHLAISCMHTPIYISLHLFL